MATEAEAGIFTSSIGCTTYAAGGERGVTTGIQYGMGQQIVGAFVRTDEAGEMWYVALGAKVDAHHHEILAAKRIDREEFDAIVGIAAVRYELGWRA